MRDQIKIYNSFECFDAKCSSCSKKTHFAFECPKLHYMPDKDFHIRRLNFSAPQGRVQYSRRFSKKRMNALLMIDLVQISAEKRLRKELDESELSSEEESGCYGSGSNLKVIGYEGSEGKDSKDLVVSK